MVILYIGDIMAGPGLEVVAKYLPGLRQQYSVDLVVAQAENVSNGKGINPADYQRLQQIGVNVCSGGNHTMYDPDIYPALDDPNQPILRPANYPADLPGKGWKYISTAKGKVLVISLLGSVVGRDADKPTDNPLVVIDTILAQNQSVERAATVVNFHGDYSSEKVIIGHYLDGRVSLVVGDHWHVPTADARVLPGGTAHVTDVGMCGVLNSSLGISFDSVITRWRDGKATRNILADQPPYQFNAVLATINPTTGLATSIQPIRQIYDSL